MPVHGRQRLKKKECRGRPLDYDRLCAVLGRHWNYITPQHFYCEMDMFDVSKLVPFLRPEEYGACWTGHDGSGVERLRRDGVIGGCNG